MGANNGEHEVIVPTGAPPLSFMHLLSGACRQNWLPSGASWPSGAHPPRPQKLLAGSGGVPRHLAFGRMTGPRLDPFDWSNPPPRSGEQRPCEGHVPSIGASRPHHTTGASCYRSLCACTACHGGQQENQTLRRCGEDRRCERSRHREGDGLTRLSLRYEQPPVPHACRP